MWLGCNTEEGGRRGMWLKDWGATLMGGIVACG